MTKCCVQCCRWSELFLAISPDRFHYLKSILEGYDNLAILSSVDGKNGIIRLRYPKDSEASIFALMAALTSEIRKEWK